VGSSLGTVGSIIFLAHTLYLIQNRDYIHSTATMEQFRFLPFVRALPNTSLVYVLL
jgi:hypothetical protein